MSRSLTNAEVNHLRRLVGWIRCGIPQAPDDLMDTVRSIAPALDDPPTEFQQNALVKMHRESEYVPQYIRAAIKALEKTIKEAEGDVVDAHAESNRLTTEPMKLGVKHGEYEEHPEMALTCAARIRNRAALKEKA